MSFFRLSPQDGLYYEHHQPAKDTGSTFVFFNALTGDTSAWENVICPILREDGFGTLTYNLRGQTDSPFSQGVELSEKLIVTDAVKLLTIGIRSYRPCIDQHAAPRWSPPKMDWRWAGTRG